jgi:hypothetical protein
VLPSYRHAFGDIETKLLGNPTIKKTAFGQISDQNNSKIQH